MTRVRAVQLVLLLGRVTKNPSLVLSGGDNNNDNTCWYLSIALHTLDAFTLILTIIFGSRKYSYDFYRQGTQVINKQRAQLEL